MDSNTLSIFNDFPITQQGGEGSPYIPEAVNRFILCSSAPWFLHQSVDNGISNSPNGELSHKTPISAKTSRYIVPQKSKLIPIQPSKKSPVKSSNPPWRIETVESNSLQFLTDEKTDIKSHRKYGCRGGPLAPDRAKHAREMRGTGACWQCRFAKVRVSWIREMQIRTYLIDLVLIRQSL